MEKSRRNFLRKSGSFGLAASAMSIIPNLGLSAAPPLSDEWIRASEKLLDASPLEVAQNEDFWHTVRQAYPVSPTLLNLNNGGVSPQTKATQDMQDHYIRKANELPSYFLFNIFNSERESVRTQLANLAGCSPEEIAINRNSSEGLETILLGLNLKAGDEIVTTNQDYPNMMNALRQREKREGIKVTLISIPVPCSDPNEIVSRFRKAMGPKTKAILCCHMINLTGQILPIKAICDMAHEKNVEVVVDGAHSFAHLDFKIPDLNCDYFATSLHKWLSAPFGTGMMYIRKEKIKNIWPLLGAPVEQDVNDIRKFENLGTRSFASELAISEAIKFHLGIGIERKQARLHFLKKYWAEKMAKLPNAVFNTSLLQEHSCALANFRMEGTNTSELHSKLFDKYKIYTTPILHAEFNGLRITPHVYTSLQDLDFFVKAVTEITKS